MASRLSYASAPKRRSRRKATLLALARGHDAQIKHPRNPAALPNLGPSRSYMEGRLGRGRQQGITSFVETGLRPANSARTLQARRRRRKM
jgi:hypothetical protein